MGLLDAEDAAYAAVEAESLALVHPWPDNDAAFAHLEFVARSFRKRGYPTLLVTATVESSEYLERLRAAVPADEVLVARLEAPTTVLHDRVARREPPDWVGLPGLIERIEPLSTAMRVLPSVDLVLETDGADARHIARRLRDALVSATRTSATGER